MENITLDKAMRLIDRTVDTVDGKLKCHSEKVAYVFYKLLCEKGGIDDYRKMRLCEAAFLHDIGCYKVAQHEELLKFEINNPYAHAVYGYIFLKKFLGDFIDTSIIKHHHTRYCDAKNSDEIIPDEAFLLHLADRICISCNEGSTCTELLYANSGILFNPDDVELFIKLQQRENIFCKLSTGEYKEEIYGFLSKFKLTAEKSNKVAEMMSFAMDFRSTTTVMHSIMVRSMAYIVAGMMGYDEQNCDKIRFAASLHDIGKLVIPNKILEKPGKLTSDEFGIIKSHAIEGYKILNGLVDPEIRDIGTLHHEKINGNGYPFGLKGDELTKEIRIVCVCDIAAALLAQRSYKGSFNKEKTIDILKSMVDKNEIDKDITSLFIDNFDYITEQTEQEMAPMVSLYNELENEYPIELKKLVSLKR